ncbi:hypothetical protein [Furfurilactobacillus curtus]|uniref:WYL domain-containing protein n=1 Tax=Furfurilactobacillus curtus TaxID=1746200 RepID=A0ABQ5JN39_9LACO
MKDELNDLTAKGFFGEESRQLLEKQSTESLPQSLYSSVVSIYSSSSNVKELNNYTEVFSKLFKEAAMKTDPNTVYELIGALVNGTKKYPELENKVAYTRFMEENQILKNGIRKGDKTDTGRLSLGSRVLTTYVSGFELSMKIFTFIYAMMLEMNQQEYDLLEISSLSTSQKLNGCRQLDQKSDYILLTEGWNDILRNAENHGDMRFDLGKGLFTGQNRHSYRVHGKKIVKVDPITISPEEMMGVILPKVACFIQGYISAGNLLSLSMSDELLFEQAKRFIIRKTN